MPRINSDYHEDARRKILDAALEIAIEKDWELFTLDEIARKVGVTKGALYSYFANRDALFRELIVEIFTQFHSAFNETLADDPDLEVMLERIADLIFVCQKQYAGLFARTTSHIPRDPELRELIARINQKNIVVMRDQISRMQTLGKIPKNGDPEEIARGIFALIIGFKYSSDYLGRDSDNVKTLWKNTVRLMMSAPGSD
jgi:AcrR family transcriptional regulator